MPTKLFEEGNQLAAGTKRGPARATTMMKTLVMDAPEISASTARATTTHLRTNGSPVGLGFSCRSLPLDLSDEPSLLGPVIERHVDRG
jgi:hypothetical protein